MQAKKFENVLQIWDRLGRVLPFAVRRFSWSNRSYFLVKRVVVSKFPYGKVFGDFYRDGAVSKRNKNIVLSCSGCYQWVSVSLSEVDAGVFSCVLFPDVPCSFRKSEKFGIMNRCFACPQHERFHREMEEEDERVMYEIDEIRKREG